MFVDLDWPLNASSLLSASAELLVLSAARVTWHTMLGYNSFMRAFVAIWLIGTKDTLRAALHSHESFRWPFQTSTQDDCTDSGNLTCHWAMPIHSHGYVLLCVKNRFFGRQSPICRPIGMKYDRDLWVSEWVSESKYICIRRPKNQRVTRRHSLSQTYVLLRVA